MRVPKSRPGVTGRMATVVPRTTATRNPSLRKISVFTGTVTVVTGVASFRCTSA